MTTPNYKLLCINLERRPDRREKMIQLFNQHSIQNYHFFNAIDGQTIDPANPLLKYTKTKHEYMLKKGVLGCALSHFSLWQKLVDDQECHIYVILEDDVQIVPDFKLRLENYLRQIRNFMHVVFIGSTTEKKDYDATRAIYQTDTSYNIYPLSHHYYAGGAFGYIITRSGAKQLIDHIQLQGIRLNIDYLIFRYTNVNKFETHPHIVFTEAVQHSDHFVDSDVQHEHNKLLLQQTPNNYQLDNYDFYPNQDSFGGDILETYMDIDHLKKIADDRPDCIAFNTYGWIKKSVSPIENFVPISDKYYQPDGLYIKKIHNPVEYNRKLKYLQIRSKMLPIGVYIGPSASLLCQHIVAIILELFPINQIVDLPYCDVCINHHTDTLHSNNRVSLNILISSSLENIFRVYDIAIDIKHKSNAIHTVCHQSDINSDAELRNNLIKIIKKID